jgi:phosphatidylglycerophosphate synthase
MIGDHEPPRRELATRKAKWAQALARSLGAAGVSPNTISIASLIFATFAGVALWRSGDATGSARVLWLLGAAAGIQLRLVCNLLDGLVAIEGGQRTPYGELFNDAPDRFADLIIFVGAGYGLPFIWGRDLGWLAGALAVLTAYVRLLGGTMGTRQYFIGPMAKQHRMAVMTAACVLATFEPLAGWNGYVIAAALAIVVVGSIVTFARRTVSIVRDVSAR